MTYSATKYSDALTEILDTISREWMVSYSGNADAPTGWFTEPFSVTQQDLTTLTLTNGDGSKLNYWSDFVVTNDLSLAEQVEILSALQSNDDAATNSNDTVFIVGGNDHGFIYSESFTNGKSGDLFTAGSKAEARFYQLEEDYSNWDTEHDSDCTNCEHDCPWNGNPMGAPFCSVCDDHMEASTEIEPTNYSGPIYLDLETGEFSTD